MNEYQCPTMFCVYDTNKIALKFSFFFLSCPFRVENLHDWRDKFTS